MRPDQERVRNLLLDTVTLLCKNGLDYKKEMKVQGLIGITLDDDDVFLVHFDELSEIPSVAQDEELESEKHGTKRPGDVIDIDLSPAKRPHHAGPGGSTPRRLDLSNTLRQQVPETKPRIKQEVGDDVVILDNDEPEDQKPGLPIEGNIEMDSNQLAALTGFRDGGGGAPPGPGQMGMPGGQGWSPGRVGPPGMPPHGSNQDMLVRRGPLGQVGECPSTSTTPTQYPGYTWGVHRYPMNRRSRDGKDKPHKCLYPGCDAAFYQTCNLRTHERKKHGRKKMVARRNFKVLMNTEKPSDPVADRDTSNDADFWEDNCPTDLGLESCEVTGETRAKLRPRVKKEPSEGVDNHSEHSTDSGDQSAGKD